MVWWYLRSVHYRSPYVENENHIIDFPFSMCRGHRDLNARTTANGVTSSQSHTKSKSEPQINSVSSSSMVSSTIMPSSWNDDTNTSTAPKLSEGRQVSQQDSTSKTIEPYKPGIVKEAHALSSLDIDFSTIPSAWNDDDIVVSDGMSKGSKEIQAAKENGKLTHLASKSPTPKKDTTVNISSKSPSDLVSSLAISKSDVKTGDHDSSVSNITPKSPSSNDVNCQSSLAANEKILEGIGLPREIGVEKLSVQISSITLNGNDESHSMAGNHQPDALPHTSASMPIGRNFDSDEYYMKLDGLLSLENNDALLSSQYGSDKHLDWTSEQQSCTVTSLNDMVNSTVIADKLHGRLMDGSDQPSYSSFAHFPNTVATSLWNDTESNPTLMVGTKPSEIQTGFSSINKTHALLSGCQDGLGTVYTPGNVSGHPGMGSHQPGAMGSVRTDSVGSFDKTASVNKDESRIISDMLSSEFNLWDDSFSSANSFVRMLRESENNDVTLTVPSWRSGSGSRESRFSFARQDNQGNCGSDQNFSLLSQTSRGNFYHNGHAFQSLENDVHNSNSLVSDVTTTG
jgi:CCR4-NOT transcription complex subunit 4